jgi:hypothetical protein
MTARKPGASYDSLLMSRTAVLQALDIGDTTLDALITRGELAKVKIGKRALVTRASFDAYVARLIEDAEKRAAATA